MAYITVNISTNTYSIPLDQEGTEASSFEVMVCASYSGRGLDGRKFSKCILITKIVLYFYSTRVLFIVQRGIMKSATK